MEDRLGEAGPGLPLGEGASEAMGVSDNGGTSRVAAPVEEGSVGRASNGEPAEKGEGRTMQPAPTTQLDPTSTNGDTRERIPNVFQSPTEGDSIPV